MTHCLLLRSVIKPLWVRAANHITELKCQKCSIILTQISLLSLLTARLHQQPYLQTSKPQGLAPALPSLATNSSKSSKRTFLRLEQQLSSFRHIRQPQCQQFWLISGCLCFWWCFKPKWAHRAGRCQKILQSSDCFCKHLKTQMLSATLGKILLISPGYYDTQWSDLIYHFGHEVCNNACFCIYRTG